MGAESYFPSTKVVEDRRTDTMVPIPEANLGLRRLGNAGWNIMPLPKALNQALNGRPMLSLGFGTFVGGSSISSIYASYYFGDIVGN